LSKENRVSDGVKRFGLRVFCPRCSQRGRFFGQRHGVRLRDVQCANCAGNFKALRGADERTKAGWPNGSVQFTDSQLEMFSRGKSMNGSDDLGLLFRKAARTLVKNRSGQAARPSE